MTLENRWIYVVVLLALSVILGEIASRVIRGLMDREGRQPVTREMASSVAMWVFGCCAALGMVLAAAIASRGSVALVSSSVFGAVPRVLVAVLVLLAGYAASIGIAAAVAQGSVRATGVRHRGIERSCRYAVLSVSVAVALTQLGVDTTLLSVAIAVLVGIPVATLGAITALGARPVASEIAAGRAVRSRLEVGAYLVTHEAEGQILAIHPVSIEVETIGGRSVHIPYRSLVEHPYSVLAPAASTNEGRRSAPRH